MGNKRKEIFAANWKMNLDASSAAAFMKDMEPVAAKTKAEVIVFPPSVYLAQVAASAECGYIRVGAQNMYFEDAGAFTGEISAAMIQDCGAEYVLCGHSERRHIFGESGEMVTAKAAAAQGKGLIPMICVGETLDEREAGETLEVLRSDIRCSLSAVRPDKNVVIAYEPVWAIGTGLAATADDAEDAIGYLREQIRELWGDIADEIRILYGGSVKGSNIAEIMEKPNVDGALVGGASLYADSFTSIIENGEHKA